MKKLMTIALVIVMIFAVTVSAAALDSPVPKEKYSISVAWVPADGSLGDAATDKNQIDISDPDEDGIVTLTATAKDGYFILWSIGGDYDIVSGDLNSAVIQIKPHSDIQAVANFVIEEGYLHMFAKAVGDGTATVDKARIPADSGELVTFTATDGKDTFTHWELDCVYDIVEGDLNSRKLVVRPYTDVYATAYFVGKTTPTTPASSSSTPSSGGSGSSPKTGDPLYLIIALAVLALGAGAFAIKKIKE